MKAEESGESNYDYLGYQSQAGTIRISLLFLHISPYKIYVKYLYSFSQTFLFSGRFKMFHETGRCKQCNVVGMHWNY